MAYAPLRSYPAAPAGARISTSDRWNMGAYATPFVLTDSLNISTLSVVVMGHTEIDAALNMFIFAAGPGARPSGAMLAMAGVRIKNAGAAGGVLKSPVTLAAGSYFAITVVGFQGQTPMLATVSGDLAASAAIGAVNIEMPATGLYLPPPFRLAMYPLTGSEIWQDVVDPAGVPLIWLGP